MRVIHKRTGHRGLVKNLRGMVRDIAFAHIMDRILIAFTDHLGTLYVYETHPAEEDETLRLVFVIKFDHESEFL